MVTEAWGALIPEDNASEEMEELLDIINESNNSLDEIEKLTKLLTDTLTPQEFVIFETLINGSEKEIWEYENPAQLLLIDEQSVTDSMCELNLLLSDTVLDIEVLVNAVACAKAIAAGTKEEDIEPFIDMWIEFFNYSLDDYEEYTEYISHVSRSSDG